jgi:hypothetical protein
MQGLFKGRHRAFSMPGVVLTLSAAEADVSMRQGVQNLRGPLVFRSVASSMPNCGGVCGHGCITLAIGHRVAPVVRMNACVMLLARPCNALWIDAMPVTRRLLAVGVQHWQTCLQCTCTRGAPSVILG